MIVSIVLIIYYMYNGNIDNGKDDTLELQACSKKAFALRVGSLSDAVFMDIEGSEVTAS